jgi:hypothetical protein
MTNSTTKKPTQETSHITVVLVTYAHLLGLHGIVSKSGSSMSKTTYPKNSPSGTLSIGVPLASAVLSCTLTIAEQSQG